VVVKGKMNSIGQPVPDLPVADVERAQQHYRDVLGFEIGSLYPGKEIGACHAVMWQSSFGSGSRRSSRAVHWVFAEDIDALYLELKSIGANIVDHLRSNPETRWTVAHFPKMPLTSEAERRSSGYWNSARESLKSSRSAEKTTRSFSASSRGHEDKYGVRWEI
jgi:hypothetical protein